MTSLWDKVRASYRHDALKEALKKVDGIVEVPSTGTEYQDGYQDGYKDATRRAVWAIQRLMNEETRHGN